MHTEEKLDPLTLTVKEAKRISGLGHTTVYKLIGEGKLHTTKVGTRTLISFASLKELLEAGEPNRRR